jgi:hypothetical protein
VGGEILLFRLAALRCGFGQRQRLPSQLEQLVARAKLLSVGTWVRNAVIYAVSKKWTATSVLIFSAVLLLKNQPWAQRRAVAAKVI